MSDEQQQSAPAPAAQPVEPGPTSGLYLDREGRWFHDGQAVRHARLSALLWRSVARNSEERLIVTTGRDVLPFAAEDAPVQARTATPTQPGLTLVLSTGAEHALAAGEVVWLDADGQMRMKSPDGRFWIRLLRPAAQAVAAAAEEHNGGLALPVEGGRVDLVELHAPKDWSAVPD